MSPDNKGAQPPGGGTGPGNDQAAGRLVTPDRTPRALAALPRRDRLFERLAGLRELDRFVRQAGTLAEPEAIR